MPVMETPSDPLRDYAERYCDGTLSAEETAALERRLRDDPQAMEFFVLYMEIHSQIAWNARAHAEDGRPSAIPPIILDLSPPIREPLWTSLVSPGGFLFSYTAAVVLVGIGLLIGWTWKIHYDRQIAANVPRPVPSVRAPEGPMVGRITGMVDCRWADPAKRAFEHEGVPVGREYVLDAGFLEITYDNGARVILEGPAKYVVESNEGGFLAVGKLTARVEKKGRESRAESREQSAHQKPHSQLSTLDSRLFSVRTPTAVVTDLGTEFGVEVERSGASRTCVFRGEVEVRPVDDDRRVPYLVLGPNEAARTVRGADHAIAISRLSPKEVVSLHAFAREMPRQTRIKVFSTGEGLRDGDLDPHWRIVPATHDSPQHPRSARPARHPGFAPQQAVVTSVPMDAYLPNGSSRANWISATNGRPAPRDLYTFRTTFELTGVIAETAVIRVRFIVDNHVDAVWLNGKPVSAPEHGSSRPFDKFHSFTIRGGFVEGTNVLEFDVYNFADSAGHPTAMALLVELEGSATGKRSIP
jgi:hypothetical protein